MGDNVDKKVREKNSFVRLHKSSPLWPVVFSSSEDNNDPDVNRGHWQQRQRTDVVPRPQLREDTDATHAPPTVKVNQTNIEQLNEKVNNVILYF